MERVLGSHVDAANCENEWVLTIERGKRRLIKIKRRYGLQCEYPPSSGPSASKPAVARPTPPPYVPQPGTTGITGGEALMAEK